MLTFSPPNRALGKSCQRAAEDDAGRSWDYRGQAKIGDRKVHRSAARAATLPTS
jgi:hypothetical protein